MVSDDLQARYDALVAAARRYFDTRASGTIEEEATARRALRRLLPKPLERDDMVEQSDADRVPVGAILRDANGKAVEVVADGGDGVWFTSGYPVGQRPSEIDPDAWPMRVVWLPEDGDQ